MHPREVLLIERCQKGDRAAIDLLLRNYHDKAYNYAYRLTKHSEEAGDVVSEAFVKVHRAIGLFRLDSSFPTWLYRIVRNCFIDVRKRKRVSVVFSLDAPIDSEEGDFYVQPIDETPSPYESAVRSGYSDAIWATLKSLSEVQRVTLYLHHHENLTYSEIAEITQTPVGTVKSRLNRAHLNFRTLARRDARISSYIHD